MRLEKKYCFSEQSFSRLSRHQRMLSKGICIQPPYGSSAAKAIRAPKLGSMMSANAFTLRGALPECRSSKVILSQRFLVFAVPTKYELALGQRGVLQTQHHPLQLAHQFLVRGQGAEPPGQLQFQYLLLQM